MALRAWGRIVALEMEDSNITKTAVQYVASVNKWRNASEMKEYINNSARTTQWYAQTDENLHKILQTFSKLIEHSHAKVRVELVKMCCLLVKNCNK